MFIVYWSKMLLDEGVEVKIPFSKEFSEDELKIALDYTEMLRKLPDSVHIVISSENSNMVGKFGVTEVDADYKWMKRRSI